MHEADMLQTFQVRVRHGVEDFLDRAFGPTD